MKSGPGTRISWLVVLGAIGCLAGGCGETVTPVTPSDGPTKVANTPAGGNPKPAQPAQPVAASPYVYGYVGAVFADLTAEGAAQMGLSDVAGAAVTELTKGGAAELGGIEVMDVVRAVDGTAVANTDALVARIRATPAGQRLELSLVRKRAPMKVGVEVRGRSIADRCRELQTQAAAWLVKQQLPNGAWPHASFEIIKQTGLPSISLTSLATAALAGLPEDVRKEHAAALDKASAYLVSHVEPDGGLFDKEEDSSVIFRNFSTSFAIQALVALDRAKHKDTVDRMVKFLLARQIQDSTGFKEMDWQYGGWNYYEDWRRISFRTDLIGLAIVLRGLAAAGLPPETPCFARARRFLERTQNFAADPSLAAPEFNGGFAFNPRSSKAGQKMLHKNQVVFLSYGSTTGDGISSMLHAGVAVNDPRTQAALRWLHTNYTLLENPGFDPKAPPELRFQQGIYFYYLFALTDALAGLGQETLTTPDGQVHYWVKELVDQLAEIQRPDGSWINPLNIMSEDDPIIATALTVRSLNVSGRFLK